MSGVIIYSSRYGNAEKCAQYLKEGINVEMELINIDKVDLNAINLHEYDTVILGSSIYVGAVTKNMKNFCKEKIEVLRKKTKGIYICCGSIEESKGYISANFAKEILEKCVITGCFGGEANIDNMKLIDKLITKIVTKGKYDNWVILKDEMDKFIKKINLG